MPSVRYAAISSASSQPAMKGAKSSPPARTATLERSLRCVVPAAASGTKSATATVTPAAVENYFNIYVSAIVEVPKGCCVSVAMENTSAQAVSFANSNMTVDRIS